MSLLLMLAVAVALTGCNPADVILRGGGQASEAQFALDPEAGPPPPDATAIPLLVREVECASGQSADGRVRVGRVTYGDAEVGVQILVESVGEADCQGNPLTPFLLELDEPIGDRTIVNIASDEIALRPAIEPEGPAPGEVGGGVLIEADESLGALGEAEAFLVEALWVRGQDREDLADLGDLSLADRVTLVLGQSGTQRTVDRADLADPATWILDPGPQGYAGRGGPFDLLDPLAGTNHLVVTLGDHPHCASPPRPAPGSLDGFTRLGITPGGIDSCLQWFALDVYVDPATGLVHGFVLDLFEP